MSEADRDEGKLAKEVRRLGKEPLAWLLALYPRDMDAKVVALAMAGTVSIWRSDVRGRGRWELVSSPLRLARAHGQSVPQCLVRVEAWFVVAFLNGWVFVTG